MPHEFIESPHRTSSSGRVITTIVLHAMDVAEPEGAATMCARWFANPVSDHEAVMAADDSARIRRAPVPS